jgi:hypothetical protein
MLGELVQRILKVFEKPTVKNAEPAGVSACERAILHAKDGYKNAQEIIRFIDTKASFFAGSAIVLLGFTMQLLKQYFELPASLKAQLEAVADVHPICFCCLTWIIASSMLSGVLSVWSSLFCLVGRPPKRNLAYVPTILFPFFKGNQNEREVCKNRCTGMTEEELSKEYECQIWNVGVILFQKIRRNRWAAWMLLAQIFLLVVGGILLLFCMQK